MKKMFVLLCFVALVGFAMAQNPQYSDGAIGIQGVDKLGAHQNGGRGCVGCHAPHSGARGNGMIATTATTPDPNTGNFALWGEDLGPLYSQALGFGDDGNFAITLPASSAVTGEDEQVLTGVVMCLSCHDGNIAKGAMMANDSYERARGLLPVGLYGTQRIPTLLGNDGTGAGNYKNDHPIGPQANLGAVRVASRLVLATCGTAPNTVACLQPDPANAAFMAFYNHYGAFNITQNSGTNLRGGRTTGVVIPAGALNANTAYVVCTTCHTPHSMYTFSFTDNTVTPSVPKTYPSYFFVAAPYNPGAPITDATKASSATQFCRQCHFQGAGGSNEASGIMTVTTSW